MAWPCGLCFRTQSGAQENRPLLGYIRSVVNFLHNSLKHQDSAFKGRNCKHLVFNPILEPGYLATTRAALLMYIVIIKQMKGCVNF